MTAEEARIHIRYSGWASRKLMDAVGALDPDVRTRPMGVSHESIEKTLAHIYYADAIWYARLVDAAFPVPKGDALPSLNELSAAWPDLQSKWERWADDAIDADLEHEIEFNSRWLGGVIRLPAWQVVNHVVNHATLHRGQVVAMLRQVGAKPPATDLMMYYFEQMKATTA